MRKKAVKNGTVEHIKKELLEALEENYGLVSVACQKIGIGRTSFYRYLESDQTFADQVREIRDKNIDLVEDKLIQKILACDTASIIFYLKCKGKHRGWSEKQQIEFCGDHQGLHITVTRAE